MNQNARLYRIFLGVSLTGFLTALIGILGNVVATPLINLMPLPIAVSLLGGSIIAWSVLETWRSRFPSSDATSTEDPVNRQAILERVYAKWIRGFLEDDLLYGSRNELLRPQLRVSTTHWELSHPDPDDPTYSTLTEKPITEIYNEGQNGLLILGDVGSGKTTLLLELARDLIQQARQNSNLPLPIILNLSSWAVNRHGIADWLVEELNMKYRVPRQLGQAWVKERRILPLLDGLDEVAPNYRSACIEALNAYCSDRPRPPIPVVCSRKDDYLRQPVRLYLPTVVTIQDLKPTQIEAYLSQSGEETATLQQVLRGSGTLQQLAKKPLWLKVLILACRGKAVSDIQKLISLSSPEDLEPQLFDAYARRMLQSESARLVYSEKQTLAWLGWLAKRLNGQTEFYLEQLQPCWLPTSLHRYYYGTVRLSIGLISGLLSGLAFGLALGLDTGRISGVGAGLFVGRICGLFTVLISGLVYGLSSRVDEEIKPVQFVWSWPSIQQRLGQVRPLLSVGLLSGLVVGVLKGLENGAGFGITYGLAGGLAFGILAVFVGASLYGLLQTLLGEQSNGGQNATPSPQRRPSVRHRWSVGWRVGLVGGLHFGLIFAVIFALITEAYELNGGVTGASAISVLITLILVLVLTVVIYCPVYGFLYGLIIGGFVARTCQATVDVRVAPLLGQSWRRIWQRIKQSESWSRALVFSLVFGVEGWLTGGAIEGLTFALIFGLFGLLLYWLLDEFIRGLPTTRLEKEAFVLPNQWIWHSAENSAIAGGVFGLLGMLLLGLVGMLLGVVGGAERDLALSVALLLGLTSGVISGLAVGLPNGGIVCLQHIFLRLFLWNRGVIPWRYVHFLDHVTERLLLRRLGGGYIFIHPLLLKYFAEKDTMTAAGRIVESVQEDTMSLLQPTGPIMPDVSGASRTSTPLPLSGSTETPDVLPCGHERRSNARYCSICGRPLR